MSLLEDACALKEVAEPEVLLHSGGLGLGLGLGLVPF